jgi:hypothetical protein
MKAKPWQIALIVIGLLVGVGSVTYTLLNSGEPALADSILLVDVETGQLYRANVKIRAIVLPARRAEDGKLALLRVRTDETGKYYISDRDLKLLDSLDSTIQIKAVHGDTGDVPEPSKEIKKYEPPAP